ncbi:MAG: PaaI family thioesterase [Anaerolineales bacterium]|jgi:acyl-coenzyme A thioesterase PaaI-like protein
MADQAIQDLYAEDYSHCYGCGRLNSHGLQIKSYWSEGECICRFKPKPYHIAIPGYVYGGLIASIIDCHATGTAAAVMYNNESDKNQKDPPPRFLTASLQIDYLKPTPLGVTLEVRAIPIEIKGRKVVVNAELYAEDTLCAQGKVVTIQMPEERLQELIKNDR